MVYNYVYNYPDRISRLLQTACLLCGCRPDSNSHYFGLCRFCHCALPFIDAACHQCGIPLPFDQPACGQCLQQPPAFDQTCCPVTYTGPLPALIHRFKTRHSNALRRLLAELLAAEIRHRQGIGLPPADLVIPVPMHWRRNLQRGNNHSRLLASTLARQLQIPLNHRLLQRTQATPVQKQLDARQRRRNLRQAFLCSADVTGLRIAVVDDVMTTGSTLQAIAQTLKQAGAAEVQCWVVARTPKLLE